MATTKRQRDDKAKRVYTDAKKVAEKHESGFESTSVRLPEGHSFFSLKKAGTYRLDIAPFLVGKGNPAADEGMVHFERTYWNHRSIGPNQDSYVCLRKTFGKRCPVCEHQADMRRQPNADDNAVKEFDAKERQLFWVKDSAEADKGWQLWEVSYHLFGKLLNMKLKNSDPDDNYDKFYHCEGGMTLKLGVEEKKIQTSAFREVGDIEFKVRKEAFPEALIDELPSLDTLLVETPYDKLKQILLQTEPADADADADPAGEDAADEDGPPTVAKGDTVSFTYKGRTLTGVVTALDKKGLATVRCKDRAEPHYVGVEDLEVPEEAAEAEEKPVKRADKPVADKAPAKAPAKGKAPVDDDDDDDDSDLDDDDDDEPSPPAKGKAPAPAPAKGKAPVEDDEEEEDDEEDDDSDLDDDDDDDEPAPKAKPGRR